MKTYKWAKIGLVCGVLSLGLRSMLPKSVIETYYSRGVFLGVRSVLDTLVGSWLPVASLYLLLAYGIYWLWQAWRKRKQGKRGWQAWLWRPLGFIGWIVTLFLWMWGYNYGRVGVEEQLNLPESPLSLAEVKAVVQTEAEALARIRQQFTKMTDTTALSDEMIIPSMEPLLRAALERSLEAHGYPTTGRVRGRVLQPRGIFLRFGSAGLYFPWTGEGHIDAGLIGLQRPYTMAHELAHGYGFGDEGTCSFWAYLTAFEVESAPLAYAIRLGYWRSLAGVWVRAEPDTYATFRATLLPGIVADLDAINANLLAYPDIMPRVRDAAYDAYLKAQGIQEGMLNYGRVVALVEAWRKQQTH